MICYLNINTNKDIYKIIYNKLYLWINDENILLKPPELNFNRKDLENNNVFKKLFENNQNNQLLKQNDAKWNKLLSNLPFRLRLIPKEMHFIDKNNMGQEIEIRDRTFEWNLCNQTNIDIGIEWKSQIYNKIKYIFDNVFEVTGQ